MDKRAGSPTGTWDAEHERDAPKSSDLARASGANSLQIRTCFTAFTTICNKVTYKKLSINQIYDHKTPLDLRVTLFF